MASNEKYVPVSEKSGRVRSGKARMLGLTPEQRSDLAKWAAGKRWADTPKRSQPLDPPTETDILIYQSEDKRTRIDVRLESGTVWLSQAQMTELFQTTKQNVSLHVKNIFDEGELVENSVVKESLTTASDGKSYSVKLYNLDVIISVGYRVKSQRGTQFRIWATERLREYIVKGFSLDDERLKNAGTRNDYFDELIQRVREIRTSEKNFWRKITSIYATSIDYDANSDITQKFFATVQNKFHYAITGHTAAEIIAERADADKPNMGLTAWDGEHIRKSDVSIAKNYLKQEEIEKLNLLVDQYLSFAELQARERRAMHMVDWSKKLDAFLTLNERDILTHAGSVSKKIGEEIASREYDKYHVKQKAIRKDADITDFDRFVRKIENERSKG